MIVTIFPNEKALTSRVHDWSIDELVKRLNSVATYQSKDESPYIKLAKFGTECTAEYEHALTLLDPDTALRATEQ